MITIEEAVASAKDFAKRLYTASELTHMRVEEVELVDQRNSWLVTLGWVEPAVRQMGGMLSSISSSLEALPRVYKVFTIDAGSGEVKSMKIKD